MLTSEGGRDHPLSRGPPTGTSGRCPRSICPHGLGRPRVRRRAPRAVEMVARSAAAVTRLRRAKDHDEVADPGWATAPHRGGMDGHRAGTMRRAGRGRCSRAPVPSVRGLRRRLRPDAGLSAGSSPASCSRSCGDPSGRAGPGPRGPAAHRHRPGPGGLRRPGAGLLCQGSLRARCRGRRRRCLHPDSSAQAGTGSRTGTTASSGRSPAASPGGRVTRRRRRRVRTSPWRCWPLARERNPWSARDPITPGRSASPESEVSDQVLGLHPERSRRAPVFVGVDLSGSFCSAWSAFSRLR